jgi:hypothetical protein
MENKGLHGVRLRGLQRSQHQGINHTNRTNDWRDTAKAPMKLSCWLSIACDISAPPVYLPA